MSKTETSEIQRFDDDVLAEAGRWRDAGRAVGLATVVATWGSSPRPVGSHFAVDQAGNMVGSVSGGCIEGSVWPAAAGSRSSSSAWNDRKTMKREVFDRLQAARTAKRPAALLSNLEDGRQALVVGGEFLVGDPALIDGLADRIARAIAEDKSGVLEDDRAFLQVFNPPLRLIVVGAVHIAQALVPMAMLAGYGVTVVDPRRAWATDARFPEVALATDWPDQALEALKLDHRTAVVTLTHDPKLDDPALVVALGSPVFYIGALGSKRTHAKRRQRLGELGVDEAKLARIHGPIGLAVGAKSPAEIAIAILAQMTQVLHDAPALVRQEPAA
jgi:xanthine dehydrogenase accessory factor